MTVVRLVTYKDVYFLPPTLQHHIIDPVQKALDYYTEMEKALEKEKQKRAQSDTVVKPSTSKEPEAHPEPGGTTKPVNL